MGPVLLVGGAGYIGTHVIEQLLREGRSVRVLDRLMYGAESLRAFPRESLELIEGNATDLRKLTRAMQGVSAVVQLAGLVGDPACSVDEEFTRHTNIIATRMVKEVALSCGVRRFIFASSCSVYGINPNEVSETAPTNPRSLYAQTKLDAEQELLLCPEEEFHATVLRFATVFGDSRRPRFDLVGNLFTAQAMVEGKIRVIGPSQWRPLIHVSDLARAVLLVLKADPERMKRQIFNVGDRRLNVTIGELAEIVRKVVSKERAVEIEVLPAQGDARNYAVSFEKIKKWLGFEANVTIEQGIEGIVSAFAQNTYEDYRLPRYNNVALTQLAAEEYHDPLQAMNLYRPLSDHWAHPVPSS